MLLVKKLKSEMIGTSIEIGGWLRTRRDSKGGFSFIEINDGSTFNGIQVVADDNLENYSKIKERTGFVATETLDSGILNLVTLYKASSHNLTYR